jgi:Zn-dependent peptidase ImmA (M78 family)
VSNNNLTEEAMMAAALRAELQTAPKVDLDRVAEQLGLTIVDVESSLSKALCYEARGRLSGRILVRKSIRETGRRRFTIAHEIGHYILHGISKCPCSPRCN